MSRSPALRWIGYLLVAALFAVACGFLSNWQFTRNEGRAAMLALVEANYDAEPVPVRELVSGTTDFDAADEWRPVSLVGEYLPADQLLVRNRPQGGTSAFEVLVPFRLQDGNVVFIDRGWVPPGEGEGPDAVPSPPSGETTVIARLRPSEPLPTSGRTAPEGQLPTMNLPAAADATAGPAVTSAYGLMVSEDPAPAERPAPLTPPTEDPGPHLSYAIQWILFAVMGFVFIGYIIRTELRVRREDAEDAAAGESAQVPTSERTRTPRARASRRRDSDAAEEDALLDSVER